MIQSRSKYFVLNYVFAVCLAILFINDHYLKFEYGNWFTGKLSDLVGIIMLPLLLAYLFPRLQHRAIFLAACLFLFWKSPFSQALIDLYNQYSIISISRVVDYTDLLVLAILPLPYYLITHIDRIDRLRIQRVSPFVIAIPAALA